jgi:hypothetical protein
VGALARTPALLNRSIEALIAAIVWDSGDGEVTAVNVWDTPGAIADFYVEGEPTRKPQRHGEPLAFYLRQ